MICQTILISCLLYLTVLSFVPVSNAIENAPGNVRRYSWTSPKILSPKQMKKFLFSRFGSQVYPKNDFNKVQYYDSLPVHPRMTLSPDAELIVTPSVNYYNALLRSLVRVNIAQPAMVQAKTYPHDSPSGYSPAQDPASGYGSLLASGYGSSSASDYSPSSSSDYSPSSSSGFSPSHDAPSSYDAPPSYDPSLYSPSSASAQTSSDDPSSTYDSGSSGFSPPTYDHSQYSSPEYPQTHSDYSQSNDFDHSQPEYAQSHSDYAQSHSDYAQSHSDYASYYPSHYPSYNEAPQYPPHHPGYVSSGTPHGTLSGQSPAAASHFYSGYGGSQSTPATETTSTATNATTTTSLRALFQSNAPRYYQSYG